MCEHICLVQIRKTYVFVSTQSILLNIHNQILRQNDTESHARLIHRVA